ncbi:hypothetical protein R8Z50_17365 [Longispora sp. K20-0274]|uniref:hypothetical protein n=1 Tax=Longispora sp. K20-0274 TaxID=3088255 RepID=UPI003999FE9C
MDQALVDSMWQYLNAGLAMDVDALETLYDPTFENLRYDEAGRTVTLTRAQFMARFRALRASGQTVGDALDDVEFVATSHYGDNASIIMRRTKDGEPVLYNFVWRLEAGRPVAIVREFTQERDLAPLLALISRTVTEV